MKNLKLITFILVALLLTACENRRDQTTNIETTEPTLEMIEIDEKPNVAVDIEFTPRPHIVPDKRELISSAIDYFRDATGFSFQDNIVINKEVKTNQATYKTEDIFLIKRDSNISKRDYEINHLYITHLKEKSKNSVQQMLDSVKELFITEIDGKFNVYERSVHSIAKDIYSEWTKKRTSTPERLITLNNIFAKPNKMIELLQSPTISKEVQPITSLFDGKECHLMKITAMSNCEEVKQDYQEMLKNWISQANIDKEKFSGTPTEIELYLYFDVTTKELVGISVNIELLFENFYQQIKDLLPEKTRTEKKGDETIQIKEKVQNVSFDGSYFYIILASNKLKPMILDEKLENARIS